MREPREPESEQTDVITGQLHIAAEFLRSNKAALRKVGSEILMRTVSLASETQEDSANLANLIDNNNQPEFKIGLNSKDRKKLEMYESLMNGAHDIVLALGQDGKILLVNHAITKTLGYQPEGLIGVRFDKLVHPDDLEAVSDKLEKALVGEIEPNEFRVFDSDGGTRWMLASSNILLDRGKPCGISVNMKDVTETRELREKLEKMSMYNSLTGLYSREHFDEHIARLKVSRSYPISFLYMDLDDFKQINDTYGHAVGDETLELVGRLLRASVREGDYIARIGGDEFAILLPNTDGDSAKELIERIYKTFKGFNMGDECPQISISIGLATAEDVTEFDQVLQKADENMYEVKKKKKEDAARSQLRAELED